MFRRRRRDEDDLIFDDWDETSNSGSGRRRLIIIIAAVLLVAAAGVTVGAVLLDDSGPIVRNSPSRSAEAWLKTLSSMDGNELARQTCSELSADEQMALQLVPMLGSVFDIVDSGILDAFPNIQTIDELLRRFELDVDMAELEFETVVEDEVEATVTVKGPAYLDIGRFTYTQRVDETWRLVRESDRWKWCGRQ